MNTKSILIVESDLNTLSVIQNTLDEARASYHVCSNNTDGWNFIRINSHVNTVLLRMNHEDGSSCRLCSRIREVRSPDQLQILMIVGEDQLEYASHALDAGANDVLIAPFEARELRMRLNIHVTTDHRRFDESHKLSNGQEQPTAEAGAVTFDASGRQSERISNLVVPQFDPGSMRFAYPASEQQISAWKDDPTVTKVALDQIMVCPCCSAVPTFRLGCGTCGSAWTKREPLIHHYACAHIGGESEFRNGDDLTCPKCLKNNLVAGSDFETVAGGYACSDCGARSNESQLIGHCLSCQHRFPAIEATVISLTGLHVHRIQEVRHQEAAATSVPKAARKDSCSV